MNAEFAEHAESDLEGMKPIKFKTNLTKSLGYDSGWYFIPVKGKIAEKFEKKDGSRRVVCTINGTETFQCALLPSSGDFVIVVNKAKREKLGIGDGDRITVELKRDDSKYGLPMPEELEEVLNQDPQGDELFHLLTPGKQRSVLYLIGKVKDVDRRIHAALILIEHLKKNDGKILGERLQEELKRPLF